MKLSIEPLSEEELDQLDKLLFNRLDEEDDDDDRDPGIFDIASLDGFLTAIVSGPVTVMPSKWLPALWGDVEPVWESEQEFSLFFELVMRHMNDIAHSLSQYPEDYEPLFYERVVQGTTYLVVDEWCEGFNRGLTLTEDSWVAGGDQIKQLLAPILAFCQVSNWAGHELDDEQVEFLQGHIAPNVREIHAFWMSRRKREFGGPQRVVREEHKVGRNDPCPCGSGRKFKHCCLH